MAEQKDQPKTEETKPKSAFKWTDVAGGVATFAGGIKETPMVRRRPKLYLGLWGIEIIGGAAMIGGSAVEGYKVFKQWRLDQVSTVTVQYF